jgi:hypothetical protein
MIIRDYITRLGQKTVRIVIEKYKNGYTVKRHNGKIAYMKTSNGTEHFYGDNSDG